MSRYTSADPAIDIDNATAKAAQILTVRLCRRRNCRRSGGFEIGCALGARAARTLALRFGSTSKENPLSPERTRLVTLRYCWHETQVERCSRRVCSFSAERMPARLSSTIRLNLSWGSIFMLVLPQTAAATPPVLDKFWKRS